MEKVNECRQIVDKQKGEKWKNGSPTHPFSKQVHQGKLGCKWNLEIYILVNWVVSGIQKFTSWNTVEYISILNILIIKEFICHIK